MKKRPNILFAFADDWGRYAGCYTKFHGENSLSALIETPNIDRIANEGVIFTNALVPAPSCTPCRSSVLSGRYFWQTKLGAILLGAVWDESIPSYPEILRDNGYKIGFTYKVWGPGSPANAPYGGDKNHYWSGGGKFNDYSFAVTDNLRACGDVEQAKLPLDQEVRANFESFLAEVEEDQPFCYWWGPTNTHRKWQRGSGKELWNIEPDDLKGRMPSFFPDVHDVREDVADYLGECMALDRGLGVLLDILKERGELDNTFIVVSGDHGIPGFPRAKCNLYDIGCEVALMARLTGTIPAGTVDEDMVNIMDVAPTFLDIAELDKPEGMPAESLLSRMKGAAPPVAKNFVVTGRERHVATAREKGLPYPHRAVRTKDFLYIRNFAPDRWPMGDPCGMDNPAAPAPDYDVLSNDTMVCYADFDASPTKAWMIHHRAEPEHSENFDLGFGKRPAEELYDLKNDPNQVNNLAYDQTYKLIRDQLSETLFKELREQSDPRVCEAECRFESSPYTDLKYDQSMDQDRLSRA